MSGEIARLCDSIERCEEWTGGEPTLGTCRCIGKIKTEAARLEADRDELLKALHTIYNRHLNPGPATGVDAIFCFRKAQEALDKAEGRLA